jgi:hypothetical protein
MNTPSQVRATRFLSVLLIAAVVGLLAAYSRLRSAAIAARAVRLDLAACQQDLADMGGAAITDDTVTANPTDPEFNRRLRRAATVAGIPDEVVSIEPGVPRRVGETDFNETLVSLRLNTVTLRQLVTFLHELSSRDPAVRTRILELAAPAEPVGPSAAAADGAFEKEASVDENWSADVTLAYLSFLPRDTGAK